MAEPYLSIFLEESKNVEFKGFFETLDAINEYFNITQDPVQSEITIITK